ncbi:MAG TPA: hypothetical protein VFD03_08435 [Clostridia bacterium]|nr:hypothetical protein [Clostridia bacterium]
MLVALSFQGTTKVVNKKEDKQIVLNAIKMLVAKGVYKEKLFG